ncbi:MAG: c-type cytochrome [Chitinophagales bacterium]
MSKTHLSDIRRFNKIANQISLVKFLIYTLFGLMLFVLISFDWQNYQLFPMGQCGGGIRTSYTVEASEELKTPTYFKGETIFKANCTACHRVQGKLVGPALAGISDKYEKEWLYKWIRNSQEMVKEGDPNAVKIFNEYNGSVMTAFPTLSDRDIDAVLEYIEVEDTAFEAPLP